MAAAIKRPPPDFAAMSPIAVVRDAAGQELWAIRLARAADEIAADRVGGAPPPAGRVYQLWLAAPGSPLSLGLLPSSGRRVIPETPAVVARLAGRGELIVSLEPGRGSRQLRPSGPVLFRAALEGRR